MKIRYTDPAADDLEESISYFRDHVSSLVADFADCVDNAVAEILANPYAVQETEWRGIRRWHIQRFRYSIFYAIEDQEIVILHIRHAARQWPWERDEIE